MMGKPEERRDQIKAYALVNKKVEENGMGSESLRFVTA